MKPLSIALIILLLGVLGGTVYFLSSRQEASQPESLVGDAIVPSDVPLTPSTPPSISATKPLTTKDTGIQQKKSLHYEQASPAHNQVFAAAPYNVTITFNFDLDPSSTITIEKDGVDYGTGATEIDSNKLTMRRQMKAAPDGVYTVKYNACWPDKTCHDGLHAFTIDSSQLTEYEDMTGKTAVSVDLANTAFDPAYLVVSKGTKVTWTNKESVGHYVNADPHAGHNFILGWNSTLLNEGDSYSYTFANPGEYPYHCSAHASQMMARIVVK